MSLAYYNSIGKTTLMLNPEKYAWNSVLYYIQFTQEELISLREWLTMPELIRYQKSVTRAFLSLHFQKEIDDSLDVDWERDVEIYVKK